MLANNADNNPVFWYPGGPVKTLSTLNSDDVAIHRRALPELSAPPPGHVIPRLNREQMPSQFDPQSHVILTISERWFDGLRRNAMALSVPLLRLLRLFICLPALAAPRKTRAIGKFSWLRKCKIVTKPQPAGIRISRMISRPHLANPGSRPSSRRPGGPQ